ncbi:hypothetical protein BAUCODRAFT_100666 [Baudoinia panamericana UAMH 10762]|uniref:Uncharacterized protein n=1 Tax=Baudoinia panamericana (strain UAMH 10762) TaxID=717646 RepID=M2M1T0_BAUPA|nr:uncharacterized protein BAUCODRAFT_100666 [Baudoinia panamericana UAMH 10762]EMD01003.1 hypothetical protein BAUCODRAFT_100666 [Baudoinia panamericana UAMH 10762]
MRLRFNLAPRSLIQLITTILLAPSPLVHANPRPAKELLAGFSFDELFARYDCGGQLCGYSSQLCCSAGSTCYTDVNNQAQCSAGGATTAVGAGVGGYWQVYTTVYVETDLVTTTRTMSSFVGQTTIVAATTTAAACNYALNQFACGNVCCGSNQYCYAANTCSLAANGGSSGYYSTYTTPPSTAPGTTGTAIAPLRGTSSSLVLVTTTASPTTTVPFVAPVATGANVTLTSSEQSGGGGLSGGAIAGIVIGVLAGLFLLGLLCFYCCVKGLVDGCLALFGYGGNRRRRRTTEVEEYERRSHRESGGQRRTWYGVARPARVSRYEERDRRNESGGLGWVGILGGLGALWALLGMKRQRDEKRRRQNEKYSESYYSSDYYTSEGESRR